MSGKPPRLLVAGQSIRIFGTTWTIAALGTEIDGKVYCHLKHGRKTAAEWVPGTKKPHTKEQP